MSTSGSHNFSLSRNEIIQTALQIIGAYGIGRTVSSEDMNFCNTLLNAMVKAWQVQGYHIFALSDFYFFATQYEEKYTIDASSARIALESDTVITKLTSASAASDTTLVVSDTTGMTALDIIGVVLDSGATHWTTIVSVDSATGLTITSGVATAAAVGRHVYTFTSRIDRPVRITSMRRITGIDLGSTSDRTDIQMTPMSRHEYMMLPSRLQNGTAVSYHYQPKVANGELYLWSRPDDTQIYYQGTAERFLDDYDSSDNTSDFPVEWLECLIHQLAVRIAPGFSRTEKGAAILPLASQMLSNMLSHDSEMESLRMMPE